MEGKNQASSSSSFTNELFGSKESSSSSSSTSFFNSIFPPVSKTHRMDYISSEETEKSYDSASGRGSTIDKDSTDKYDDRSLNPKTDMSLYYQQPPTQPCHLSSSIYYGGQDVYTNPRITKDTPANSTENPNECQIVMAIWTNSSTTKMEKMMGVLHEETGGRGHSITRTTIRPISPNKIHPSY